MTTTGLYALVKELSSLQALYEEQQQLQKMEVRVKLWTTMKEFFQILDDIATAPISSFDDVLKEQVIEESFISIERSSASSMQDVVEKIRELFVTTEITEMKIQKNAEEYLDGLGAEMREQKKQLKMNTSLAKNYNYILSNGLLHQLGSFDKNLITSTEDKENI